MRLGELRAQLARHGVSLTITEEGKLRPHAAEAPPAELIEAIREHRAALLRQVEEGRTADGRLDVAWLATQPGRCGTCTRWRGPDTYSDGQCRLGRAAHGWADGDPLAPVTTTVHHACQALVSGVLGWHPRP